MTFKHTFVICAYGESAYLEACIQSLLQQSYTSQVLVYTSTPNALIEGLCQKYNLTLTVGDGFSIGSDWNRALACGQTDLVTIAHQDDTYHPLYAQKMVQAFTNNPDTVIAYTDYGELREDGSVLDNNRNLKIKRLMLRVMDWFPKWAFWRQRCLAFGNAICCPAVTYSIKGLNGFKFDEQLRGNLDWIAWYHLAKQGRFSYCPESLMYHRIHSDSETSKTISDNVRTQEDYETFRLFWPDPIAKLIMKFYIKSQDSNG